MVITSRKGYGRKNAFGVFSAAQTATIVYESQGQWFSRNLADTVGSTVKLLGQAEDAIVLPNGKTILCVDGVPTEV